MDNTPLNNTNPPQEKSIPLVAEIYNAQGICDDKNRDEGNVFRPGGLEEIAQGRGRCPQCAVLVRCKFLSFL